VGDLVETARRSFLTTGTHPARPCACSVRRRKPARGSAIACRIAAYLSESELISPSPSPGAFVLKLDLAHFSRAVEVNLINGFKFETWQSCQSPASTTTVIFGDDDQAEVETVRSAMRTIAKSLLARGQQQVRHRGLLNLGHSLRTSDFLYLTPILPAPSAAAVARGRLTFSIKWGELWPARSGQSATANLAAIRRPFQSQ